MPIVPRVKFYEAQIQAEIRLDVQPFVEPEQRRDCLRNDKELAYQHAGKEQPEAERQVNVDVPFLMRIEASGDERPQLPEDPGATNHNAEVDADLEVNHHGFKDCKNLQSGLVDALGCA